MPRLARFTLLTVTLLLITACRAATPDTDDVAPPAGQAASATPLATQASGMVDPSATPDAPASTPTMALPSEPTVTELLVESATPLPTPEPTPQSFPDLPVQPGPQPNGRVVYSHVVYAELDGDEQKESLVSSAWAEAGDTMTRTLQIDVLDDDGSLLYSQNTWEPLGDPSTGSPTEMNFYGYDAFDTVHLRDLTGDGLEEVLLQSRSPGTSQFLTLRVVSFAAGEAAVLFDRGFYKGVLSLEDEGFTVREPQYLYNEANCCSCRADTYAFRWEESAFVATSRTRAPAEGASPDCPPFPRPAEWETIDVAGESPSPRSDAALVYDPPRHRLILFGGRSGSTPLDDTWALDLASQEWTLLVAADAPRPSARFSMVAGLDSFRDRVIITTGQAGPTTFFNDVWSFDLVTNQWEELPIEGEPPLPRYGSAGGIYPYGSALYLTHGFAAGERFNDTWRLDLEGERWENVTPSGELPLNRCLHAAALSGPESLALFGGCSSGYGPCPQGDSWLFDGAADKWNPLAPGETPSARQLAAMTLLFDRNELMLFGGQDGANTILDDLWVLDPVTEQWRTVTPEGEAPPARHSHAVAWVQGSIATGETGYAVVFGGTGQAGDLDDLWILNPGDE